MRRFLAFCFMVGALLSGNTSHQVAYAAIAIALYVSKATEKGA